MLIDIILEVLAITLELPTTKPLERSISRTAF